MQKFCLFLCLFVKYSKLPKNIAKKLFRTKEKKLTMQYGGKLLCISQKNFEFTVKILSIKALFSSGGKRRFSSF